MKKFLFVVVAAMLAGQVWAATTFTIGNFEYIVTSGTNVSVFRPSNSNITEANIPSQVTYPESNGVTYNVTSIGENAFSICYYLTSVTIPESVISIGESAFFSCRSLTSIEIPSSVASIGKDAFNGCNGLTSVTIPNSVTSIGDEAFYGCVDLTSVEIPNSVTSIPDGAFYGCFGLTSVSIGNSVTSIGSGAFSYCDRLTSIEIPSSVTSIGDEAFYGCVGLTSVTIGNSVTSIGDKAFYDCKSLTKCYIPKSVTDMGTQVFNVTYGFSRIYCEAESKPDGWNNAWKNFTSEFGKVYYKSRMSGDYIYQINNTELQTSSLIGYLVSSISVEVPQTVTIDGDEYIVTGIGDEAFMSCDMASVTIPNSVTSIGHMAFYGCISLTSVTLPNSVASIGNYAFTDCYGLTSIDIPESVTSLGECVCDGCNIKTLTYNTNAVTDQFSDVTTLETLNIGDKVTYIGEFARGNLKTLNYNTNAVGNAFSGCGMETVNIGNSVTSIARDAFRGCSNLTSITIPNSVTSIGADAFRECDNMTSIMIQTDADVSDAGLSFTSNGIKYSVLSKESVAVSPYSYSSDVTIPEMVTAGNTFAVTSIGKNAFRRCRGLMSISFPESVTSIGQGAFSGCDGLASVTIPNSVTSIGDGVFDGCNSLKSVSYNTNAVTNHFAGIGSIETINIGNSVTSISNSAFEGCEGLTSIEIPNSVTSIGDGAFGMCTNLTSIVIPESVTSVGDQVTVDCSNATLYCQADSRPSGWSRNWNLDRPVNWNCKVIKLTVNNEEYGSVEATGYAVKTDDGSMWYTNNAQVVLTATPQDGYHVVWDDGSTGNNSTFVPTESKTYTATFGTHTLVNAARVEATCTTDGHEAGMCCSVCNLVLDGTKIIPAFGHTEEVDAAIAPTCTGKGKTEGKHCSVCKAILVAQEDVAALNHNYGEPTYSWSEDGRSCAASAVCQRDANHVATENATITSEVIKSATCENKGETMYCAEFETELFESQTKTIADVPALGHNYLLPIYAWSANGGSCTAMAICLRDASHTITEKATITSEVTIAATCEGMGATTHTASFENEVFESQTKVVVDIPAQGHTTVVDDAVEPTCESFGLTEGSHCSVCGHVFKAQNILPALPHTEVVDEAVEPTCTIAGKTEGKHCDVCGAVLQAQERIPALGHTVEIDLAVPATCTVTGCTDGRHCAVCNTVLVAQKEVPAFGHEFGEYVYNNDATTEADGTETALCRHGCGTKDTRVAVGTRLSEVPGSVTAVAENAANAVNIYAHHNIIVVENAEDDIIVYNAMGKLVFREANHRVRAEINVSGAGVYIVKTGSKTQKIVIQ